MWIIDLLDSRLLLAESGRSLGAGIRKLSQVRHTMTNERVDMI